MVGLCGRVGGGRGLCRGGREGKGVDDSGREKRVRWEERGNGVYLFLLVALLAQVFPSPGHLGAAHGVFLGREVFFRLGFCVWGGGVLVGTKNTYLDVAACLV